MITRYEFRKGKPIIRQGTHGTSAFIIEKGRVEVVRVDEKGNRTVLTTLKEKDIFGEMGLIAGWQRTASVIALEDVVVGVLTRETFLTLPAAHPAVISIKKIMSERLKTVPDWLKKKF